MLSNHKNISPLFVFMLCSVAIASVFLLIHKRLPKLVLDIPNAVSEHAVIIKETVIEDVEINQNPFFDKPKKVEVIAKKPQSVAAPIVAPPPPVIVKEPEKAPTLPYQYVGRLEEDGIITVILQKNDNYYTVKVGDVIDGLYKIKSISDNDVIFLYKPLNEIQRLVAQ